MNLRPLSKNILKSAPVFLTKIHPTTHHLNLIKKQQRVCTRHFSSIKEPQAIVSSDDYSGQGDSVALTKLNGPNRISLEDQETLFADPTYFQTPVLMLHCSWTDFAVSFHAPDK